MVQQWEVESATGQCSVSGKALVEGEEFYAVLFEDGESFRRCDYSVDAWTGPPDGAYCFFKTRVPVKAKKRRLLVDNDILVNFFLRLKDESELVRLQFRFVLALILMRKRLLKYDGTQKEGDIETWRMILVSDKSVHDVVNPRLTDDQIEGVSEQLTAILHGDMGEWAVPAEGDQADLQSGTDGRDHATG